jgi:hypothetical protein
MMGLGVAIRDISAGESEDLGVDGGRGERCAGMDRLIEDSKVWET